jgi:hypothetical protein
VRATRVSTRFTARFAVHLSDENRLSVKTVMAGKGLVKDSSHDHITVDVYRKSKAELLRKSLSYWQRESYLDWSEAPVAE